MTIYVDPAARAARRPGDSSRPPGLYGRPANRPPNRAPNRAPNRPGTKSRTKTRKKNPAPIWAKICVILGAVVMVVSGAAVVVPRLVANWAVSNIPKANLVPEGLQGKDISGPINFLLLGMDQRAGSKDLIRADTIIILHVPADHRTAYLVSLPRDAEVHIPAFPATKFPGEFTKINAAFAFGSQKNGQGDYSTPGRERGAALTMMTINQLVPGGLTFNGAAIINFDGFKDVLSAIGGVYMCVDVETHSIHFDNKGVYHTDEVPYNLGKVYKVGCQNFDPVSALDYSRQRHFDTGDYVRQRHQQQLLMAIFKKLFSGGTLTDPSKISTLQKAAGNLLTLDLGKIDPLDWIVTLKGLDPKHLVMIKTNGGKITPGTIKGNEAFSPDSIQMLKAVHDDTLVDFLSNHPDWITTDNTPKQS